MVDNEFETITSLIERFKNLSPFELKNELISMAKKTEQKGDYILLNAGRGNPNWTAATPRQAFFTLGLFAVEVTQKIWKDKDLAGIPYCEGIAHEFYDYAKKHPDAPGMALLEQIVAYGIEENGFEADRWVYELVDGIIGDHYPVPDRMLRCIETVVNNYIMKEMGGEIPPQPTHDLFAVEGGTAAMCYIFDTLCANYLLEPGERIALMVPIFTPYLEIPELSRYDFEVTYIYAKDVTADGQHTWQYPKEEIDKLKDPAIKALFVVNPSNPPSVAIDRETMAYMKKVIDDNNPTLMIITDDVYGTFTDDFRSLMTEIPYHTIGVYSYSKYFGVTGWRLGVVAIAKENIYNQLIKELSPEQKKALSKRYNALTSDVDEISFIDRMVADSREVALNHTAGLSTPQQVQMAIFSIFALLDRQDVYKKQTQEICHRRLKILFEHLDLPLYLQPHSTAYYREIDLLVWARVKYGEAFVTYLKENYPPEHLLYRLAMHYAVVLLNGNGFKGPDWSIRISLANLNDDDYARIGDAINEAFNDYVEAWHRVKENNK